MAERNYASSLRSYRRSVVALRKASKKSNFFLGIVSPVLLIVPLSLIYSRLNIDFELHWDVLLVESFWFMVCVSPNSSLLVVWALAAQLQHS